MHSTNPIRRITGLQVGEHLGQVVVVEVEVVVG
jgi:hypothetical protein